MYIPKADVEFNKQELKSAISDLAQTENVSIAVFDNEAKLVARTKDVDAKGWTIRLKRRLKSIGLFQTDLMPTSESLIIAISPIMSGEDLAGYIMIGNFYYSATGKIYEPLKFDRPVFDTEHVHSVVDLGKTCVISSCDKIIPSDPQLADRLAQYIVSNLDKPLDSQFLGKQFHISPKTVREVFDEKIGLTVRSFISSTRIKAATNLLWQIDSPIETVAKRIGFTEAELRKEINRFYKVSPEEYRQSRRDALRKKIPIVFVTNDDYAPYLSTAIYSLIKNRDPEKEYIILIFHSGLSLKSMEALEILSGSRVDLEFVDLEEQLRPYEALFHTCAHYTKETYYRLFVPTFLGRFFDRVIYLDADLVVNTDIGEIFAEVDPEKTINAVLNFSTEADAAYIESLGLDPKSYINAGVMTIDCKRYIEADYFGKAIDCLKQEKEYQYVDQDVLNQICRGDIGILQPSWNLQWNNLGDPTVLIQTIQDMLPAVQTPKIVHYTIEKPWNIMLNEYGDYYAKYAAENRVLEKFKVKQ